MRRRRCRPCASSPIATECRELLQRARATGRTVGLVPTMGALHAGHVSLMTRARAECEVVAVTIFVNPLQFGDPDDIAHYPRTLEWDLAVCAKAGVDVVFVPTVTEMYPSWPATGPHDRVRAGSQRRMGRGVSSPGHFDGVATVVAKLFSIAGEPAGPTSARRTTSSWRWCARWRPTSRCPWTWWAAPSCANRTGWPCRVATSASRAEERVGRRGAVPGPGHRARVARSWRARLLRGGRGHAPGRVRGTAGAPRLRGGGARRGPRSVRGDRGSGARCGCSSPPRSVRSG